MLKHIKIFVLVLAVSWLGLADAALAGDPIYTGTFSNSAVKGYDTVSYFQGDGVPVKGSEEFQTQWRGANWYFSSQKNLDAFKADPKKYAPQYGGYCAWAVAHDTLAKGDPTVYNIVDGKLYLNYDQSINSSWTPRKEELIIQADTIYPNLVEFE